MEALLSVFIKALLIGVAMAAPLGPISMLLIKKTLEQGLVAGVIIACGAACADALYCALAGFAMASVTQVITQYQAALRIFGKLMMTGVLLTEYRASSHAAHDLPMTGRDRATLGLQVFFLTLANPVTVLTMSGIFLSFNIVFHGVMEIAVSILGVFLGSCLWCFSLSCLTAYAQRHLPKSFIRGLQLCSLGLLACLIVFL